MRPKRLADRSSRFLLAFLLLAPGCGDPEDAPSPPTPPLLQPFQGSWRFDALKTRATWPAGATSQAPPGHPDLTIAGDEAIESGLPEGSYLFFAMHPHGRWACGKAWHHEDRHDPGDMSKEFVRLEREGDQLRISVRATGDPLDPRDPDMNAPSVQGGSASECRADHASGATPSAWATYVFEKK